MADKDTITKDYMQDSATFADAFNFLIYGGKQVIKPEQLRPLDTTSIVLPYGEDSKTVPIQKYREWSRLWKMTGLPIFCSVSRTSQIFTMRCQYEICCMMRYSM